MITHVTSRGDGPPLVCHPGGPGFDGAELRDLGGLDASRTLLLVDPRGTGRTPAGESYLLADYVADLEELRVSLDLEQIDLLGFSHGGLVAAAYAAGHPERVRKLVLAHGVAGMTEELQAAAMEFIGTRAGEPWYEDAIAAVMSEPGPDAAENWNRMVPLYFSQWDDRFRPLVETEDLPWEPMAAFAQEAPDVHDGLGRIAAETLVLTGRDDFVAGPLAAGVLADGIPGAELVVLDGAGHFAFLEQPETFRAAVEAFLAR